MTLCWEMRGCDSEMQSRCPHNTPGESCPAECSFAMCLRPTHKTSSDFNLILNPERDFDAAIKENCHLCEFFLKNGPKISERKEAVHRQGNPNRFIL